MIIWINELYENSIEGQGASTLGLPYDAVDAQSTTAADGGLAALVAERCMYGYRGSQEDGLTAAQEQEVGIYLDEGYRTFLLAHDWSFARPVTTAVLWATTTATATMTVGGDGNKTITASASTFYPTMVGHTIVSTNGSYVIDGYISATVVTVTEDASNDTGLAFQVTANGSYRMPDDFGGLIGDVYYQSNDGRYYPITNTGIAEVIEYQQASVSTDRPTMCAVNPLPVTGKEQRFDLMVWRVPAANYTIRFQYQVLPDALKAGMAAYGGTAHAETLKYSCFAAIERSKFRVGNGPDEQQFQKLLAASIRRDNIGARADTLGMLVHANRGDRMMEYYPQATNITAGGVSYP